jgi:hypothetical protein
LICSASLHALEILLRSVVVLAAFLSFLLGIPLLFNSNIF